MLHRNRIEKQLLNFYDTDKLGLTVWSPLASGILTGKYNNGIPEGSRFTQPGMSKDSLVNYVIEDEKIRTYDEIIEKSKQLKLIADELKCSEAQLALAWILKNKNVSVILLGASKVSQLEENLKCLEVVPKLTDEIMEKIEKTLGNKPDPYFDWRSIF